MYTTQPYQKKKKTMVRYFLILNTIVEKTRFRNEIQVWALPQNGVIAWANLRKDKYKILGKRMPRE